MDFAILFLKDNPGDNFPIVHFKDLALVFIVDLMAGLDDFSKNVLGAPLGIRLGQVGTKHIPFVFHFVAGHTGGHLEHQLAIAVTPPG